MASSAGSRVRRRRRAASGLPAPITHAHNRRRGNQARTGAAHRSLGRGARPGRHVRRRPRRDRATLSGWSTTWRWAARTRAGPAVVASVAAGCALAEVPLLGGETAEHPGVMPPDQVDLAGAALGWWNGTIASTDRPSALAMSSSASPAPTCEATVSRWCEPSSASATSMSPGDDRTRAEVLLDPAVIYSPAVLDAGVRGRRFAHVTGGGSHPTWRGSSPSGPERSSIREPGTCLGCSMYSRTLGRCSRPGDAIDLQPRFGIPRRGCPALRKGSKSRSPVSATPHGWSARCSRESRVEFTDRA